MSFELNEISTEDKKIYCENGRMPHSFFTTYIKDYIPKNIIKQLYILWENIDDTDIFIDYKLISLPGDAKYNYTHLWLLDLELAVIAGTYYAVLITNINTSSSYSLVRCSFDIDEPYEDEDKYLNICEIVELVSKYNNKEKIKELLEKNI